MRSAITKAAPRLDAGERAVHEESCPSEGKDDCRQNAKSTPRRAVDAASLRAAKVLLVAHAPLAEWTSVAEVAARAGAVRSCEAAGRACIRRAARAAAVVGSVALVNLGGEERGAPEAVPDAEGLEGGVGRAVGVWRARFTVLGREAEDVVWIGALEQVVALHAEGAGDVAAPAAEGIRTWDALALASVGSVKASPTRFTRVAASLRRGSRNAGRALALLGLVRVQPLGARRLLRGARYREVARVGGGALARGGEVRGGGERALLARQRRRRALGAVVALLARAAARRARFVLVTARRTVLALTQPGNVAVCSSTAARARLAAVCAGGRARGSGGALLTGGG